MTCSIQNSWSTKKISHKIAGDYKRVRFVCESRVIWLCRRCCLSRL